MDALANLMEGFSLALTPMNLLWVVVGAFLLRRHLERRDRAAGRVEGAHHVLDRAALARGVDALQDDEQRALLLGEQALLQVLICSLTPLCSAPTVSSSPRPAVSAGSWSASRNGSPGSTR